MHVYVRFWSVIKDCDRLGQWHKVTPGLSKSSLCAHVFVSVFGDRRRPVLLKSEGCSPIHCWLLREILVNFKAELFKTPYFHSQVLQRNPWGHSSVWCHQCRVLCQCQTMAAWNKPELRWRLSNIRWALQEMLHVTFYFILILYYFYMYFVFHLFLRMYVESSFMKWTHF